MSSPSEINADLLKSLTDNPNRNISNESDYIQMILSNFRCALEQHNAVFITNLSGEITYVNNEFCKFSKYTSEELIGQSISFLSSRFHSKEFFEDLWATISSGRTWSGVMQNRSKDDAMFWARTSIFPFTDDSGTVIGYIGVETDITREVELNERNMSLVQQLEEEHKKHMGKKQALIGIIEHIDEEKLKILREIKTNLEVSIFPLLEQVVEKYPKEDRYLQVLKQNLMNISKPIFDQTRDWKTKLTAKEMQICSLIKQGLVIKEIAPIMHLSPRTIEKHRENIRKKLGLTERKMNLSAYLIEQGL